MRRSSQTVRVRPSIFVGAEGAGEQGFVRWLRGLVESRGIRLHLDVFVVGGGDSLVLVEAAIRRRDRGERYRASLLPLDEDRLVVDGQRGVAAIRAAQTSNLHLIVQRPNQEGLLLRLFSGDEQRFAAPAMARRELLQRWPEYHKPVNAVDLARRFLLEDLRRAARFDVDLSRLLGLLGL